MYESVLDESSSELDPVSYPESSSEDYSIDDIEQGREEPAVTPLGDSSILEDEPAVTPLGDSSFLQDEPLEVARILNDPGETASDALILAKLQSIDDHLTDLSSQVKVNSDNQIAELQRLQTIDHALYTGLGVMIGLLFAYAFYRWLSRFF